MKIVVTGPESSGKSTLVKHLNQVFDTSYFPEYARLYLTKYGPKYQFEDLYKIFVGQNDLRPNKVNDSELQIFDTDALTLYIWSTVVFKKVNKEIEIALSIEKPDHYLLCKPDIPWQADPLRENPEDRDILFELYKNKIELLNIGYTIIEGDESNRLKKAIQVVNDLKLKSNLKPIKIT
jgi:nicotinamide riboside kinase